jgi:large subunit ribosomal protein L23
MNLFSTPKKTTKANKKNNKPDTTAQPSRTSVTKIGLGVYHDVLKAPWLSEKALIGTENGVYVFEVPRDATKHDIAAAVESVYSVIPRQVRIVNLPAKRKALRTRRGWGTRAARYKAYVSLKKGDTIQFA